MDKNIALKEVNSLIKEGEIVLASKYKTDLMDLVQADINVAWRTKIIFFLKSFLDDTTIYIQTIEKIKHNDYKNAAICMGILNNVKDYIEKDVITFEKEINIKEDDVLDRLFTRFHKVAKQLKNRYSDRDTLEINDEYDVQDLLHSLLQLYFDDIRPEECTASYAGSSGRVDFLLKNEKIVIVVKKTRKGLADKEVGNQLIEDIDRYKSHVDCEKLVCFVYDPEERISNATGLINDLEKNHTGFVKIYIQPNN